MDIHVGNIPFKWTEKDLEELFSPFGEVESVKIIIDKITRQNKGFGFVVMNNAVDCGKAIGALDGKTYHERMISVKISIPNDSKNKKHSTQNSNFKESYNFKKSQQKKSPLPPWKRKDL